MLHRWLDNWNGVGLIVRGMFRQGFAVDLSGGENPGGWWVTFLRDRAVGGAPDVLGTAMELTPWAAAQKAAWQALRRVGAAPEAPPP